MQSHPEVVYTCGAAQSNQAADYSGLQVVQGQTVLRDAAEHHDASFSTAQPSPKTV